jgi:hypothetical protein
MAQSNKKPAVLAATVLVLLSLSSWASGAQIDDDDAGFKRCCQKFGKFWMDHPDMREDYLGLPADTPASPDEAWFENFCLKGYLTENGQKRTNLKKCEVCESGLAIVTEIAAKKKEEKGQNK